MKFGMSFKNRFWGLRTDSIDIFRVKNNLKAIEK